MTNSSPVLAMGFTWPDLSIEEKVLAAQGHEIIDGRNLSADDPLWAEAAGVLLGTAQKLEASRLAIMSKCRGVVRYGIGYDNVDVAAAKKHGIQVAIVRDYCVDEVAEHALACGLALARALPLWDRNVRSGVWRKGERPRLHRLSSLTFGVIGFGLIGRAMAEKAHAVFGSVLIHDPVAEITDADRKRGYGFSDSVADLVSKADIVSIHVPLSDSTRGMIGKRELAMMKPSASVINVSRGGVVDEKALLEAVTSRKLFGAALDTFENEPLSAASPLVKEPNILLTPHVAWMSEEAEISLRQRASEELATILAGRHPTSPVN